MHSFRQRPLLWLFFMAIACLDAVAVAVAAHTDNDWIEALILGQAFVAGGWAALGRGHRLAAAAVLIIAAPALTALVELALPSRHPGDEWRWVLGSLLFFAGGTAIFTYACRVGIRLLSGNLHRWAPLRFPVIELFGWTIVVAIVSLLLREAVFKHLREVSIFAPWLFAALVAGLWMAIFLARERLRNGVAAVIAAAGLLSFFWVVPIERRYTGVMAGCLLFVACWILVMRLDEHDAEARPDGLADASDSLAENN